MLTEYEVHFKHEEGVDNMLNEYKLNDETLKLLKEAAPPPPKGDFFLILAKSKLKIALPITMPTTILSLEQLLHWNIL